MISQSDTEALKALVAAIEDLNGHNPDRYAQLVGKRDAVAKAACNALPALERLLASQGEAVLGNVPPLYPQPSPGESITVTYEESPPLAEPDVEARGIAQEICKEIPAYDGATTKEEFEDIVEIIAKHLRQHSIRRPQHSGQADVEAMAKEIWNTFELTRKGKSHGENDDEALEAIIRKHSGQREGWVKCSERMPEADHEGSDYSKEVLVFAQFDNEGTHYFRYETAYWSTHYEEWFMDGGAQEVPNVTHWKPLPAAPDKGRL